MKNVKTTLVILATIITTGCFGYDFPLSERQSLPIDASILGTWEPVNERGKPDNRMTVLRSSATEYSIQLGQTGDQWRAYPINVAGSSCVQFTRALTPSKNIPAGAKMYLVMTLELVNGNLDMKLLNPELIKTNLRSSAELRKAFLAHKEDQNLFIRTEVFRRVNPNENRRQTDDESRSEEVELVAANSDEVLRGQTEMMVRVDIEGIRDIPESIFRSDIETALRQNGIRVLPLSSSPSKSPVLQLNVDAILSNDGVGYSTIYALNLRYWQRCPMQAPKQRASKLVRAISWNRATFGIIPAIQALSFRNFAHELTSEFIAAHQRANASR